MAKKRSQAASKKLHPPVPEDTPLFFHDYEDIPDEEPDDDDDDPVGLMVGCGGVWGEELVNEEIFGVEFLCLAGSSDQIWQMMLDNADDLVYLVQTGQLKSGKRKKPGGLAVAQMYAMTGKPESSKSPPGRSFVPKGRTRS